MDNKIRNFAELKLLSATDEKHPLTTYEIINALRVNYNCVVGRKTLYDDMNAMSVVYPELQIISGAGDGEKNKPNKYYFGRNENDT